LRQSLHGFLDVAYLQRDVDTGVLIEPPKVTGYWLIAGELNPL
jgi:hypothetical protein